MDLRRSRSCSPRSPSALLSVLSFLTCLSPLPRFCLHAPLCLFSFPSAGAASGQAFPAAAPDSRTAWSAHFVRRPDALALRHQVRRMFQHAYDGYIRHAFPLDELKPRTCQGEDTLGGYALTLIDALDTLALMGNHSEFAARVMWLGKYLNFDKNVTISVFETNIRVLGGLLSAHLLASDDATGVHVPGYAGELLVLAEDLGRRMLPAFDTPTGIPYGSVNLRHGIHKQESEVTSTAGGGTLILEFATLSRLTGDPVFEDVARTALRAIWQRRSRLGLVGAHINIISGEWTHKDSGIGTSIDSFYEYLLKGHVLLGDEEYLQMFRSAYSAALSHLFHDPWYVEVNMDMGVMVWPLFNSLQAFWPGLQVQAGDIELAVRTHRAFFSVWRRYGFTPEGYNLQHGMVQPGQASYPLRPELAESTYWLYKATRDPWYLEVGRDIVTSLELTRCPCGFCHVANVETQALTDHMESFFLAETVKYLFLLFDLAATNGDNLVDNGPYRYVLTTEGHMLPMTPEISFPPASHCSYLGAFCGGPKSSSCRLVDGPPPSAAGTASGEDSGSTGEDSSAEALEPAGMEASAPEPGSGEAPAPNEQEGADDNEDDGYEHGTLLEQLRCPGLSFWRTLGMEVHSSFGDTFGALQAAASAAAVAAAMDPVGLKADR